MNASWYFQAASVTTALAYGLLMGIGRGFDLRQLRSGTRVEQVPDVDPGVAQEPIHLLDGVLLPKPARFREPDSDRVHTQAAFGQRSDRRACQRLDPTVVRVIAELAIGAAWVGTEDQRAWDLARDLSHWAKRGDANRRRSGDPFAPGTLAPQLRV
jgi:hypothetical protein